MLVYRCPRKLEEICRLHLSGINDASAILWREHPRRMRVSEAKLTNPWSLEAMEYPAFAGAVASTPDIFCLILPSPFSMFRVLEVSNLISCCSLPTKMYF